MTYINGEYNRQRETIDAFETRREAVAALIEYRMAFSGDWELWLSSRPCANWKD